MEMEEPRRRCVWVRSGADVREQVARAMVLRSGAVGEITQS